MPPSSAEVVEAFKMQFRGLELSVFCACPECERVRAFRVFSRHKVRETLSSLGNCSACRPVGLVSGCRQGPKVCKYPGLELQLEAANTGLGGGGKALGDGEQTGW